MMIVIFHRTSPRMDRRLRNVDRDQADVAAGLRDDRLLPATTRPLTARCGWVKLRHTSAGIAAVRSVAGEGRRAFFRECALALKVVRGPEAGLNHRLDPGQVPPSVRPAD